MKNYIYVGTLKKVNISYYFEITETEAYIEKDNVWSPNSCRDCYGFFTIEQARKCYAALKAKGFVEVEEDFA